MKTKTVALLLAILLVPAAAFAASTPIPIQLQLRGSFQEGNFNLVNSSLGPNSYTIPARFSSLLIKFVSCEAIVPSGAKVQIMLRTQFSLPPIEGDLDLIELIPDNEISGALAQPRQVAHAKMHAYLGISTPDGPVSGDTITLMAQRDTTTGTGGVVCTVSGELGK
jgi:hypothetical protein